MDLPMYCIVGSRPVKAVRTEAGGMSVLAYDWETGDFQRDLDYLSKIMLGDGDVNYVSEQAFTQYVEQLRQQRQ